MKKKENFQKDEFSSLSERLNLFVNLLDQYHKQKFPNSSQKMLTTEMDKILLMAKNIGGVIDEHAKNVKKYILILFQKSSNDAYDEVMRKCLVLKNDLWSL